MPKLTVKEFATNFIKPAISRQAIQSLVQRGYLNRVDGKIDTEDPKNAEWIAARQGQPLHPCAVNARTVAAIKRGEIPPPSDDTEGFDAEAVLSAAADLDFKKLTKSDIDKLHKLEGLLKIRVEREAKRGELIDRTLVRTVFGKLYQIDSNELRTLGGKLSADIAGIFGVEDVELMLKVEQKIDTEVVRILAHIKRLMDDFLVKQGTEVIG